MISAIVFSFSLQGCATKPSTVQSQPAPTKESVQPQIPEPAPGSPPKNDVKAPAKIQTASTSTIAPATPSQPEPSPKPTSSSPSTSTTTKKTQPQIQFTPTILAPTDTKVDFSFLKALGFNITSPTPVGNEAMVPVNNFKITWDGDGAPNFVLRVVDWTNNPYDDVVFWAYIGNVHNYTVPASLLKPNHLYTVELEATNGTNYNKQGYFTLAPKNVMPIGLNVRTSG